MSAEVVALGLLDEPPETVGEVTGERGALLDVLLLRCRFLAAVEDRLVGFPPEIVQHATRMAGEHGAQAVLDALDSVAGMYELAAEERRALTREARMARAYGLGKFLGMDERDPNMRIWSGEPVQKVFGL
jgi:hypothetical protein